MQQAADAGADPAGGAGDGGGTEAAGLPEAAGSNAELQGRVPRRPIRIVTGQYAPYTGEDLPEEGMLSEMIRLAISRAAPDRGARISFVNDWKSHIDILLPQGAFDLGLPWFLPDCSRMELLSDAMRVRCTDYNWSDAMHELVVGYFVRPDSPLRSATAYSALRGATLCRPRGFYTFDLEQEGLSPPAVAWENPDSVDECLRMLVDGGVDVVPISVNVVDEAVARLELYGEVAEVPALADIVTMHAIAHRTNPFGRIYLTLVNRGLREMRDSGEWFDIVSRHLAMQAERRAAAE
jgi:polar amino acid transport system substrate-binding protein